jgi:endonuclease/exonuclease/phosphatase family metal-dependent hydrolase
MMKNLKASAGALMIAGLIACTAISTPSNPSTDNTLRVVTWNIEHLGEAGEGCVPRTEAELLDIADYVRGLDADIISFQEVTSEAAAQAVFPSKEWRLFVSNRVYDVPQPLCRQDPTRRMGHMRTGFAVRRGISAELQPELSSLGDTAFRANDEPHGVDIKVTVGDETVRMLSVHLTSGCAFDEERTKPSCTALFSQAPALRSWIEARSEKGEARLVAGDFNRHWKAGDAFWMAALGESTHTLQIASRGIGAVDHLLLSPRRSGLRLQSVEPQASATDLELSDHEPVIADLRSSP